MSESRSRNAINLNMLICFNFYSGAREIEQLFRQVVGPDMTMQKSFILDFLKKGPNGVIRGSFFVVIIPPFIFGLFFNIVANL